MINEGFSYVSLLDNLFVVSCQPIKYTPNALREKIVPADKKQKKLVSKVR